MIVPIFLLDSNEKWLPVSVEMILNVKAQVDGKPLLDLSQLDSSTHKIDFPTGMQQPDTTTTAVYHRVVTGGDLFWHQFWHFWLYNPKEYVGFGAHEGDWEFVQLGCIDEAGDHPVLMTTSQHKSGEKRELWRTEFDDGRPKVYVAVGSHANYFTVHHDITDDADGAVRVEPQVLKFGPWADWDGKWGNSDNSPGSLSSHPAWRVPHIFHGQAHG